MSEVETPVATVLGASDALEQLLRDALAPTYLLVRKLGAGGMGSVYLARDPALKRLVAVKVLAPELSDDPGPRARFQREAEAVASLSHPNVVAVYSVGELANGVPYFVMQHVNGRSFADRIEESGPIDVDSARRYLGDVASALAAAHKQGIIHRDIKPANILHDDESNRALVTDFGIASVLASGADETPLDPKRDVTAAVMTRLTQTGVMVGTPAYMSPEQLLAEPVTSKTDVYSLGLLGYELLTGHGPYSISSPGEIIAAHIRDVPRPLVSIRPDVDPELETVLHSCLAKQADERPTAEDVARRLSRGASVLLEWPPPALERVHGQLRAATVPMGVGALLVALPMTLMMLDVANRFRQALPPVGTIAAIAALGVGLFVLGTARLVSLVRAAAVAVRSGHGWRTVAEVAADHRRDGGALIAGGREYATLLPTRRAELRRRRVVAGVLSLAAAIVPLVGYVAARAIGGTSDAGMSTLLDGAVFLPLLLWAVVLELGAREAVSLRGARTRLAREAPRAGAADLVSVWRSTFEDARRGQKGGTGFMGKPRWLLAAGIVLPVATLVATVVAFGLGAAGVLSRSRYDQLLMDGGYNAQEVYETNRRMLPYGTVIDTTITPRAAGEAWHELMLYWGRARSRDEWAESPLHRPPQRQIEGSGRRPPVTNDSALVMLFEPRATRTAGSDWLAKALRLARHGFTERQRVALRDAAATYGPTAAAFAVVAHSRRTDFWASALKALPAGSDQSETSWQMVDRIKAVYTSHLANVALDIEAGRVARAEARIRELVGAGLSLNEDRGDARNQGLMTFMLLNRARQALLELYGATGRTESLLALLDAARPASFEGGQRFRDGAEATRIVRQRILGRSASPTVRWQSVLFVAPYLPCLELRELVFGPDAESKAFWRLARATLVRDSLDDMLFRYGETALEHPTALRPNARAGQRLQRLSARMLDYVVGGHRFEACIARRELIYPI